MIYNARTVIIISVAVALAVLSSLDDSLQTILCAVF